MSLNNLTPFTCILTDTRHDHGAGWDPRPPNTLKPYDQAYYADDQSTAYGPSIGASYLCGGKYTFTVWNQQNFCSTEGGSQHNSVSGLKGLDVTNEVTKNAVWPDQGGAAYVSIRKTTDFALYAPQGLLSNNASSTLSHPALDYRLRGTWQAYHPATTYDESNLDTSIQGVRVVFNNTRLVGNSVLALITHDTKGNRIQTFINITEYHNKLCIIPEKENTIGSVVYNISSFHAREGRYYSNYKSTNICGEMPYKITFKLGNIVSGLLLPIEVYAYDTAGNSLSPVKLLIPTM